MAKPARSTRPRDVQRSLEQWALDHGRVFIVLRAPPAPFTQAITQPMQRIAS
jgi:hypothetical protein